MGQTAELLQRRIEAARQRLAHFSQERWVYSVMTDRESLADCFASMDELLARLVR